MTLLEALEGYQPWNEQEERDRAVLLGLLGSGQDLWTRGKSDRPPDGLGLGGEPGPEPGPDGVP